MTESVEDRGGDEYRYNKCAKFCTKSKAFGLSNTADAFIPHLVIHNFFSQTGCHHLLQSFLFALCLSCQLCRAVTKPGNVILEEKGIKK